MVIQIVKDVNHIDGTTYFCVSANGSYEACYSTIEEANRLVEKIKSLKALRSKEIIMTEEIPEGVVI